MKQMDRLEVYDSQYSNYANRRALYLKHVRFWHFILVSRRIDLFIGSNIPHEVYDYVILGLCKLLNIDTHFLFQSAIPDTVHPLSDLTDFTPAVPSALDHFQRLYHGRSDASIILSKNLSREWERQNRNTIPFYMAQPFSHHANNNILEMEYASVSQTLNSNTPYIYFPLHYQPEITTNPLGGQFCDQVTAITLLQYYMPKTVRLVVKEHPMQNWIGRGSGFYQNILEQCKNVVFVPKSTSSHDLISNSLAVATVTGTAGWEALFRRKPVIIFGNIFYQNAPGVFRIKSRLDCERAIQVIFSQQFHYSERALKLFLLALESTTITATIDPAYRSESQTSASVSEQNLVAHFLRVISCVRQKRLSSYSGEYPGLRQVRSGKVFP